MKLRRVQIHFVKIPETDVLFKTKRIQRILARALLRDRHRKGKIKGSVRARTKLTKVAN